MHKAIISDTSCLILLDKIGELEILNKLFGQIFTTPEVANEFVLPLPSWIEIKQPLEISYQSIINKIKATNFRITQQLETIVLKKAGE